MTNLNSARSLRGSTDLGLTTKRRQAGTSLVEILVVIVIFLIGILAVVQIFPRGFQLLLTTRNNSMATALGRDAIERLKGNPELIPDQVVPVRYVNGVPTVDPTANPLGLAPLGDAIDASGHLTSGGAAVSGDWMLAAGPNVARRILGEGHRLPAPREVGPVSDADATRYEQYGGLLVLDHNPIDPGPDKNKPTIVAYANELSRTEGGPRESAFVGDTAAASALSNYTVNGASVQVMASDGSGTGTAISGFGVKTPVVTTPYEFFTVGSGAPQATLLLPALTTADRTYRIRLSAYVGTNAGVSRVDYTALSVLVPRVSDTLAATPQLVQVSVGDILQAAGVLPNGMSLYSVEPESVRVAPQYRRVESWSTRASLNMTNPNYIPLDPFEMKVLDKNLGVLLFSPAARNGIVSRPGGVDEPLLARVDYDVRDWRVISEDFRLSNGESALSGSDATVSLSLQSLKVGGNTGPDGLSNGGIFTADRTNLAADGNSYDPAPSPRDNVMVIDLTTGYEVQRYRTESRDANGRLMADVAGPGANSDPTNVLVSVDKSRGSVTFRNANPNAGGLAVSLIPPSGNPIVVSAMNRTFRVLYRARQEWAVQTIKSASQYSLVSSLPDGANFLPDQAYIDLTSSAPTHIYFAASQVGNKVTIDRIAYQLQTEGPGGPQHDLEGQDFVIQPASSSNNINLPYVDIRDVLGTDAVFSARAGGAGAQGIKGASVMVRVLWNPDAMTLTANPATNFARIDQYNRGWRRSTTETYLRAEETR